MNLEEIEEKVVLFIHAAGIGLTMDINTETKLGNELGMDSLDVLALINDLEKDQDIVLNYDATNEKDLTVADICSMVAYGLAEKNG